VNSLSTYDGWTVEEIVARNSHELTAMHVIQAREYIVHQRNEHAEDMRRAHAQIAEAHRIGLAVMRARRDGRKTVRIDEVAP
jgi:hypothetical protein